MEYIVISARSRTGAIKISKILFGVGVDNKIINTPKEARIGCGLSVAVRTADYKRAVFALSRAGIYGEYALFLVRETTGERQVKRI